MNRGFKGLAKQNNVSSDNKNCLLKFSSCDNKYPLYNMNKEELKEFIKFAKLVENISWQNIKVHKGLKYEALSNLAKPQNISKDIILSSMRLSQKSRIIGYRQLEFFYIVWFDVNHKTC